MSLRDTILFHYFVRGLKPAATIRDRYAVEEWRLLRPFEIGTFAAPVRQARVEEGLATGNGD